MEWTAVMRVLDALEGAGVDYAVVGGVAVNLHGLARGTRDIDVFLAPTAENIDRLKTALRWTGVRAVCQHVNHDRLDQRAAPFGSRAIANATHRL